MKVLYISIIVIINFLFQTTILQYFAIGGVIPNITLIILVTIALLKGKKIGGILGISMGLLQDIILSNVIGINSLIYFFIGYLVGTVDNKVFKDNMWVVLFFTGISTIFFHIFFYIIMYFLSIEIRLFAMFRKVILIEVVYNMIVSIPIFKGINKLFRVRSLSFKNR